ncbi:NADH:flavin oxidoreductase/NADH oxidase-like protein [Polyplosphaeria fusca]|uniref:NADH:flavin oxidoreductase/NADH oxidase-like protein n=1 Tax=Polyplosphaeria fusca TaxID=682080 RepID=A0A9P4V7A5_9PLEO|nr:NADH:flavin oxidoreductase/NADH oxidase-like protein [Polyplosphaeria fusca]
MVPTLGSTIQLPSGLVLPNRLVKAAMNEQMETGTDPSSKLVVAYDTWASGGWGALITGNVDVSTVYRGSTESVAVVPSPSTATRDAWKRWAIASQKNGTPALIQLVHPGRQSPAKAGNRGFLDKSIAPSAVAVSMGSGILERLLAALAFGTPREMTVAEIEEVIQQFVSAAKQVHEAGFDGIQLHGAHGYLITQFLSPKSNLRTDDYGGTPAKRARIVVDIVRAIRKAVPATFAISIKLNSADVGGSESLEESLEQVGIIAQEQIDFLEISGGSYENMRMATGDDPRAARTIHREAFFLDYAKAVRERFPNVILMVTGGFRSRKGMQAALDSKACDLVGLGRPAAAFPHLPTDVLLNKVVEDKDAVADLSVVKPGWFVRRIPIKAVHVSMDVMYYVTQIQKMGQGKKPQPPPKV